MASLASARRALNTSDFPSGENAHSSSPPKGFEGTSPSIPLLNCRGTPIFPSRPTRAVKSCEREPVFHRSKWRTKRRVYSMPLPACEALASNFLRLQARSVHSGKTSSAKARRAPSSDSLNVPTSSGRSVTCPASPERTSSRQICEEPLRVDRKYSHFPSGDQRGDSPLPSPPVSRRSGCLPSSETSHRLCLPLLAS